jgi:hypothetical protein
MLRHLACVTGHVFEERETCVKLVNQAKMASFGRTECGGNLLEKN